MKQVECNKCGKVFEVEGEWGYCPFCENDNMEVGKERLDCEDICPNYYSSWEEGTCMECCEIYNRGECPVVYVNDLEKQVADLEAKLAVADDCADRYWKQLGILEEENNQLKQQLAEKDNTITNLIEDSTASKELLKQQLAEKDEFLKKQKELFETVDRELYLTKDTLKHHTNIYNSLVESRNQDKISFAVEQLEKVKEWFISNSTHDCNNNAVLIDYTIPSVVNLLNLQIKELKEKK